MCTTLHWPSALHRYLTLEWPVELPPSVYDGAVFTNNAHMVLWLLRLALSEPIRISASVSNHSLYHWPATYRFFHVPNERLSLFFFMSVCKYPADEVQSVWKAVFKMKMCGKCTVECLPASCFRAEHRRFVDISGWGTIELSTHLVKIALRLAGFPLAVGSGHSFSCGIVCTICEFSNSHRI